MGLVRSPAKLAIDGGRPVRERMLPIARPVIGEAELAEVAAVLRGGQLATGARTARFELEFAGYVGCAHAVGTTSGSAALRLALEAAGVGPGDEVLTTPLTFVATAHAVIGCGARPVFADVDRRTWNLDPDDAARRITRRTRAILPVHFAGRPCDVERLTVLAERHGLALVADAAHAIESQAGGRKLATWFPLNAYSFHPTKNLTTAEGGMAVTDDSALAERMRRARLHYVAPDPSTVVAGSGVFDMDVTGPGLKCNMSEIQAGIGIHQLARIAESLALRERLWRVYQDGLRDVEALETPAPSVPGEVHARHLYCVVLRADRLRVGRLAFRRALEAEGVATGHHYPALHRTSFYAQPCGAETTDLPHAEYVARHIVTLPLHLAMDEADAATVVEAVHKVVEHYT